MNIEVIIVLTIFCLSIIISNYMTYRICRFIMIEKQDKTSSEVECIDKSYEHQNIKGRKYKDIILKIHKVKRRPIHVTKANNLLPDNEIFKVTIGYDSIYYFSSANFAAQLFNVHLNIIVQRTEKHIDCMTEDGTKIRFEKIKKGDIPANKINIFRPI